MKIFHISDLHFGKENRKIIQSFKEDVQNLNPDLIIISGDLTQRAKPKQFKMLQTFLNELSTAFLTVPGNHDVPWNPLERLYRPFARYKKYVHRTLSTSWENEHLTILGLSSVNPSRIKDGILTKSDFQDIDDCFANHHRVNLLFFHHNFDYQSGWHKPLENSDQFLNYLKGSNVQIVCTGHLHFAQTSLIKKNDGQPCLIVHAGSLSCSRTRDKMNSYYILNINASLCIASWRVYKEPRFETENEYQINLKEKVS